jgi:uncharacterized RDD family membrane protein YckC
MSERLSQTVDIETPELVVVSYTVAGLGSRVYAALIDLAICALAFLIVIVGVLALGSRGAAERANRPSPSTAWAVAVMIIMQFVVLWGYYLLFEGLRDGQTPGKRMLGLRAVRDGGYSVGFSASAIRNLLRFVDLQPLFTYLVGITSVAVSKSGKRIGDLVAGTIVVREALVPQPLRNAAERAPEEPGGQLTAVLSDAEFHLLERWSDRRSSLTPERRAQITSQVAARLRASLPDGDAPT